MLIFSSLKWYARQFESDDEHGAVFKSVGVGVCKEKRMKKRTINIENINIYTYIYAYIPTLRTYNVN